MGAEHTPAPEPGTARRERDGAPADLRDPAAYPVTAACMTCGQRIRIERWFRGRWYHIEGEDE